MKSILARVLEAYRFKGLCVPSYMHDGLIAYLEEGRRPGEFLMAVLSGELFNAYQCADEDNFRNMAAYVAFLYNHANPASYGTKEKVLKWLDTHEAYRQNKRKPVTGENK
jgi:hypothetical protein